MTKPLQTRFLLPALSLCLLLGAAAKSDAATSTSNLFSYATGPGDYQLSTNWTPNLVPNAIDDSALFSANLGSDTGTQATFIVNLNGPVTLGNLTLGDSNNTTAQGNGFYNIANGAGGSLTFDVTTGNATLQKTTANATTDTISATVTLNDNLTAAPLQGTIRIDGAVGGPGGIFRAELATPVTVAGGALLLTNNANSYTGPTVIQHGQIQGVLNGDIPGGVNSILGSAAATSAIVVGDSGTAAAGNTNTAAVLTLFAGNDTANYTIARNFDTSQATGTGTSTIQFLADTLSGTPLTGANTNKLTLAGTLTTGTRVTQITASRSGMMVNIAGDIVRTGATTGGIRFNSFPPDPNADGRGSGTIRFSNLARNYAGSNLLIVGQLVIDGNVGALNTSSPIGLASIDLSQGSGGNIVGAANFAGGNSIRDTSQDTVRSVFLENAGNSFARTLAPGNGSLLIPAAGGYASNVSVINGFQIGGLNPTGLTTFSGAITPGNPAVGASTTNPITVAVNLALMSEGAGTVLFSGNISDGTTVANTVARVTINQLRNHPSIDGTNNAGTTVLADGNPDTFANNGANFTADRLVGTAKTGAVVVTGANSWDGTTEVLGGKFLIGGSISGNTVTVASGATLGGTGTINAGIVGSTLQVSGTLAPGGRIDPITPANGAISDPGTLISNKTVNFLAGSTFALEINGAAAGLDQDQLLIAGGAAISITGNSNLALTLGFAPAVGQSFTMIDNQGAGLFSGTFANLAEGAAINASFGAAAYTFQASYLGGNGNDLVLTVVPEPGTMLSMLAGMGVLLGLRRRRRA